LLGGHGTGAWSVVTPEVVFGCVPATVPRAAKLTVQLPLAGRTIPLKFKLVAFAGITMDERLAQLPLVLPPTALIFARRTRRSRRAGAVSGFAVV
jgi:hypothetical protein